MQRRLALVLAVGVASFGVVACGSSSSSSSGASGGGGAALNLKIGSVLSLTGPIAAFGPSLDKAATLAVNDANRAAKAAGVNVHVSLSTGDEGSSPEDATSATRQLVSQGASCIVGGLASADSIAMAQGVTIPAKVVQISPGSTSVLYGNLHKNGGTTFRTIPSDALQSVLLADYMAQALGGAHGKLVSVAARNDSYGAPASQAFVAAWRRLGGSVSGPLLYDPNAASYDSEAARIVAGHPAAFVIFDTPSTYAKVGAALLRTGAFSASKLYTTSGLPSTIAGSGIPTAALEGAHVVNAGLPGNGPLLKAYEAEYADSSLKPKQAQPYNENSYDAAMICALAAAAAHSTDGAAIAKKIPSVEAPGATVYNFHQLKQAFAAVNNGKSIDYAGVSGSTQLDSNGDPTGTVADITQYQKGSLALLKQVRLKNGSLTAL